MFAMHPRQPKSWMGMGGGDVESGGNDDAAGKSEEDLIRGYRWLLEPWMKPGSLTYRY